jgi:hypothetical protein
MPDRRTYGFNRDDATELVNSIGSRESWYPEIRPRATGGGGGIPSVIFTIKNAYETLPLSIEAEFWNGACDDRGNEYQVPDADLNYGLLRVIDVLGCFFNEPSEVLVGKKGIATRYARLGGLGVAANDCAWVVHAMCALSDCDEPEVA